MSWILRWILNAGALYLAAMIVPGIVVNSILALVIAALVIGLLNAVLKPFLVALTLPITVVTLGLFYLVLNGILFALAAYLTPGFAVEGFVAAFLGALIMTGLNLLFQALFPGIED